MNAPPLLEVRQLAYRYPSGRQALEGVAFHLGRSERLGLVGPNGAGKSTLLRVLTGVLPPSEGSLLLDGQVVAEADLPALHRRVGIVFQRTDDMLFTARVADDVAFGPRQLGWPEDRVQARVQAALTAVGKPDLADRVPHHLSGGEKRAVAIACALAMEPEVLLLDEPTSDLDPRARRSLLELLRSLETALVVASHDLEFVLALCERAVVVDDGRVVADGAAAALLGDEPLMLTHGLERPHSLIPHAEPHRHDS